MAQHSLNAKVDLTIYNEFKYVMKKEGRSINSGTEKVIEEYVDRWKKKNKVEKIDLTDLES